MKNLLNSFIPALFCAVVYILPSHAMENENHVFSPEEIFEQHKGGKVTLSHRTTLANELHKEGITGQCKDGKRLKAAIIDMGFYPEYTAELKKKGLIDLDACCLVGSLSDIFFNSTQTCTHGSGVMEALHLIAPDALLLPMDLNLRYVSTDEAIAWGIRNAIKYGADVINISRYINDTPEIVEACQEAIRHGIPIFLSSGNASYKNYSIRIDEMRFKEGEIRNPVQDLFEKLGGKGIYFVGALKYGKSGKEKLTSYTQRPCQDTKKRFLCAVGNQLPIHTWLDPDKLSNGTSFAAPTVAGGYILLKQYVLDMGYTISPEALFEIMYETGRDVTFSLQIIHPGQKKSKLRQRPEIHKSMDLWKAKMKIDEMYKPAAQQVAPVTSRRQELLKKTAGTLNIKANPIPVNKPVEASEVKAAPRPLPDIPKPLVKPQPVATKVLAQPVASKTVTTPEPVAVKKKWAPVEPPKGLK